MRIKNDSVWHSTQPSEGKVFHVIEELHRYGHVKLGAGDVMAQADVSSIANRNAAIVAPSGQLRQRNAMEDFSKGGMLSFAEMMTNKGWINANTGGGYKAALKKVLGDLEDSTD